MATRACHSLALIVWLHAKSIIKIHEMPYKWRNPCPGCLFWLDLWRILAKLRRALMLFYGHQLNVPCHFPWIFLSRCCRRPSTRSTNKWFSSENRRPFMQQWCWFKSGRGPTIVSVRDRPELFLLSLLFCHWESEEEEEQGIRICCLVSGLRATSMSCFPNNQFIYPSSLGGTWKTSCYLIWYFVVDPLKSPFQREM